MRPRLLAISPRPSRNREAGDRPLRSSRRDQVRSAIPAWQTEKPGRRLQRRRRHFVGISTATFSLPDQLMGSTGRRVYRDREVCRVAHLMM